MAYEKFLKDRLIKKQRPDFRQIEYQLKRARRDLKTSRIQFIYRYDLGLCHCLSCHDKSEQSFNVFKGIFTDDKAITQNHCGIYKIDYR